MFAEEKVRNEVAIMTFLKENTKIPVPRIIHHGMGEASPETLGPFILMEYIAHASDLASRLRVPGYERGDRPYLNPNIEESKLEFFYAQVADILLELSKPCFDKIGSVVRASNGVDWTITARPLTMNMNELVQLGNFPPRKLPDSTFETASSYFLSLAETAMMHLTTQRNDAVDSEDGCRAKYVARKLFKKLASEDRLRGEAMPDTGPFRLFCDDLRRTNILLDENMKIVAVLDWEFTYSAPVEFTCSPPSWLLLEMPEEWPRGIADWAKTYQPRLDAFLRVLRRQEDAAIANGNFAREERLSESMRKSWDRGDFWVNYGARKSWAFDALWGFIDKKLFGGDVAPEKRDSLLCTKERMSLLSIEDKDALGPFVRKKMKDRNERRLDDWDGDK